ncbi:hypothetical protein BU24DRAFT_454660 [Aaosphaeria arxii CBS 175.79]|uniref:Rhodopsin domain-containing protein n=1 Tax=Aaosphaeria arxii CBS 175.79 TaxID=1450172 RepID=A0A6A5XE54_9PLEO|nr:uncharacterized protein BU24DRAFT_454660 [Aaosphaeria arxii CBS 175.79]KAF2011180.1 hypothetical protein BU24DRAFT_454660 [Aaosphaeria arxii CBS 175.79]
MSSQPSMPPFASVPPFSAMPPFPDRPPHSRSPKYGRYLTPMGVTVVIAIFFLILRFSYKLTRKNLGIAFDDTILLTATAISLFLTYDQFGLYFLGFGRDVEHLTPDQMLYDKRKNKLTIILYSVTPLCNALIRCSLAVGYLRVFSIHTSKRFCYPFCGANLAWAACASVASLVQCAPVKGHNNAELSTDCQSAHIVELFLIISNAIFDFIIYVLPVIWLRKIRIPRWKRALLIAVFGSGMSNIGLSAFRISLVAQGILREDKDSKILLANVARIVGTHIGIICACLPYLRFIADVSSLIVSYYKKLRGERNDGSSSNTLMPNNVRAQARSDVLLHGVELKDWV